MHNSSSPYLLQEKVEMMVDFLRKSFGERINQMDWLSDFSKQASIEKLNAITAYSAYPAELFDSGYVSEFYSSVSKIDDTKLHCIALHSSAESLLQ
jgi:predicted metalloendopeptidase